MTFSKIYSVKYSDICSGIFLLYFDASVSQLPTSICKFERNFLFSLTCNANLVPQYVGENGVVSTPAMLEVTAKCPSLRCKKCFATSRESDTFEKTFNSNISRSTCTSIFSHVALCDRPALLTKMSN